jgi:hypothetical protein
MPLETDADILAMFDPDEHASAALYTPAGEAPMSVSVILDRAEGVAFGGVGLQGTGWQAMLPVAQVPDRPQRGELLSVGTRDFTIETAEADQAGAIWTLTLRRA